MNFEKNYLGYNIFFNMVDIHCVEAELRRNQYDKKALEVILPDIMMTENSLNVLNDFKKTMEAGGLEVWYVIAK